MTPPDPRTAEERLRAAWDALYDDIRFWYDETDEVMTLRQVIESHRPGINAAALAAEPVPNAPHYGNMGLYADFESSGLAVEPVPVPEDGEAAAMEAWASLTDAERLAMHEDDSYGGCVICREYVPHTDDSTVPVAFPCAVVQYARLATPPEPFTPDFGIQYAEQATPPEPKP